MNEPSMIERVKVWARTLKRDVIALWLAVREPSRSLVCQGSLCCRSRLCAFPH